MLITSATLQAAQKISHTPYTSIRLENTNLPALSQLHELGAPPYTATAATVAANGSIIRAAHNTAAGSVMIQVITDPTDSDQWAAWATHAAGCGYPALLNYRSTTVLIYQNLTSYTVYYQLSTNNGASWGTAAAIWTPAYLLNHTQSAAGYTGDTESWDRALLTYAYGQVLAQRAYNPVTNTWSSAAEVDAEVDITATAAGLNFEGEARAAVTGNSGATYKLQLYRGSTPVLNRVWLTVSQDTATGGYYSLGYPAMGYDPERETHWLTFQIISDGNTTYPTRTIACTSSDYEEWSGGTHINHTTTDRLTPLPAAELLASGSTVYQQHNVDDLVIPNSDIHAYTMSLTGINGLMHVTVNNTGGDYDSIADYIGASATVFRGIATSYTQFINWIVTATEISDTGQVTITLTTRAAMLRQWISLFSITIQNDPVTAFAQCGSLVGCYIDASKITALPNPTIITIGAGQSPYQALLITLFQYQISARWENVFLTLYETDALPTTPIDLSSHQPRIITRAELPTPTHAIVIGEEASGEAWAATTSPYQLSRRIRNDSIATDAAATAAAAAATAHVTGASQRYRIMPHYGLVPNDYITINGVSQFVRQVEEERNGNRVTQVITTGDPQTFHISSNTVDETRDYIRQATVESFDPANWTATIQIDRSPTTNTANVGHHLTANMMTNGTRCLVHLIAGNPETGVIVATYSGAPTATPGEQPPYVNTVEADDIIITADHQLIAYRHYQVDGSITVNGELIIL